MKWSTIKSFLNNPIVKISYIVVIGLPILIEILEKLGIVPNLGQMPFNIFYSSVIIIFSFIIYSLFAPLEIKKYNDHHEYVSKNAATLYNFNPDKKKNIVLAHLDSSEKKQKAEIESLYRLITVEENQEKKSNLESQLKTMIDPLYPGCVNRFLEKEWYKKDHSNKTALIICTVLNVVGSLLALWVFGERIYIVFTNNFTAS